MLTKPHQWRHSQSTSGPVPRLLCYCHSVQLVHRCRPAPLERKRQGWRSLKVKGAADVSLQNKESAHRLRASPRAYRRPRCIKLLLESYYRGYWIRRPTSQGFLYWVASKWKWLDSVCKKKGVCFSCVWCYNIPVQEMTVRQTNPSQKLERYHSALNWSELHSTQLSMQLTRAWVRTQEPDSRYVCVCPHCVDAYYNSHPNPWWINRPQGQIHRC